MLERGKLCGVFEGAIEDIFYRFDTMISNSLDLAEFKEMYEIMGWTITQDEFNTISKTFCSTPRGITIKGFKDFWKSKVEEVGEGEARSALNKLGYD